MKLKSLLAPAAVLLLIAGAASADNGALQMSPPGAPYIRVSDALPLPEFIPGLGSLFVDPNTLPAGPFLAYDHEGKLSATVYMTPLDDLKDGVTYDGLAIGAHNVSSVDVYYNAGHPGVEKPHAHVVLFHDDGAKARLAK